MRFHHDCGGCCEQGRCHFCLRPGRPLARAGEFTFLACATHFAFLSNEARAPVVRESGANAVLIEGQVVMTTSERLLVSELAASAPDALQPELAVERNVSIGVSGPPLCLTAG